MKSYSTALDKAAIGLSAACAVHCLLLPALLVLTPAFAGSALADESFHLWLLIAVLPVSLLALTWGCRLHKNFSVLAVSLIGLITLFLAALLGHQLLGETIEKLASILGALLVAIGHFKNHQLCRTSSCRCH